MLSTRSLSFLVSALLFTLVNSGCNPGKSAAAPPNIPTPQVSVSTPVQQDLVEAVEFTGQTDAVDAVDIRARVSGYLTKILFKAGAEVKVGDPLFEIDPRPYQAEVDRIQGELKAADARLKRLTADLSRSERLIKDKIITPEDYEKTVADRNEVLAAMDSTKASLEKAMLDLSFSSITAPIAGRVSREQISIGNLVTSDSTLLTNIVSQDPVYVNFDMDEQTLLRLRAMVRDKTLKSLDEAEPPIELGLANEQGYPHHGVIDFAENRITQGTGTLRVRARFKNEDRSLIPGLFARVRIPVGQPRPVLQVPERAIGSDQERRFLLIVGADDVVESRTVKLGLLTGHLRVIESGLRPGEKVIVNGLQRARSGIKVKTITVDPLTLSDTAHSSTEKNSGDSSSGSAHPVASGKNPLEKTTPPKNETE